MVAALLLKEGSNITNDFLLTRGHSYTFLSHLTIKTIVYFVELKMIILTQAAAKTTMNKLQLLISCVASRAIKTLENHKYIKNADVT